MSSKVYSAAVVGVEAFEVEIEVHAGWGNTDKIAVVGLLDTAVKESKDRVTSAITNSGLCWPYGQRIAINWHRRMSGRKDPASISRSLSACSSWRKITDCLISMRSASRVNWLYRGNCAGWRESYRLPWTRPSVHALALSAHPA
jgi:hypothetical protein